MTTASSRPKCADHGRQQAAAGRLVRQVGGEGLGAGPERLQRRDGVQRLVARLPVVHGDVEPAPARCRAISRPRRRALPVTRTTGRGGHGSYNGGMQSSESVSVSAALPRLIHEAIARNGGWLPFDRFMAMALYAPGLGYYANDSRKFGHLPQSGSDFVTAPELSPLFGRALARRVAQALAGTGTSGVWEFGAGSGALAEQLLDALGESVQSYTIVDLSGSLRERQRERLARFGGSNT